MRKLILLFFSFWLILANSCTLKSSIVQNRIGKSTSITQELEKSSLALASFTAKSCKACAEKISAFTPVLSKTIIKNIGDLPLLILKSILLLGLVFFFKKTPKFINSLIPHKFNSRLYLQLKRLQIYA